MLKQSPTKQGIHLPYESEIELPPLLLIGSLPIVSKQSVILKFPNLYDYMSEMFFVQTNILVLFNLDHPLHCLLFIITR